MIGRSTNPRRDPDFERRTRARASRGRARWRLIGARLRARRARAAWRSRVAYRPELSQQHGFFHAGIVATIADTAGGFAAFTLFPTGAGVLTVEFKINLLAAADGERLVATGEVIRSGRTLTVCRIDAHVEKGGKRTHCATGMQTLMCLVGRAGVRAEVAQDFWASSGLPRPRAQRGGLARPRRRLAAALPRARRAGPARRRGAARACAARAARVDKPRLRVGGAETRGRRGPRRARELEPSSCAFRDRLLAAGSLEACYLDRSARAPSTSRRPSSTRSRRRSCATCSTAREDPVARAAPASCSSAASA